MYGRWRIRRSSLVLFIFIIGCLLYLIQKSLLPHNGHRKFSQPKPKGLNFSDGKFYLHEKEIRIFSGAMHYFRVVPDYWEDRLKKMRAAGINTVETYCPWNLHEETKGTFTFDGILDLRRFVQKAHDVGLYVILRPGPYICAEWEFGGLPSWLLADPNMKVRSLYFGFMKAAGNYIQQIVREIADLQYSQGGPIIAFQIENEYGVYGSSFEYMEYLRQAFLKSGVTELMFTSNNDQGLQNEHLLPGTFVGLNFNKLDHLNEMTGLLRTMSPHLPYFATEFWTGWFSYWSKPKTEEIISSATLRGNLKNILKLGFHVNFYMFHGGTTFGFMNGGYGNTDRVITSYDYGAPISEDGALTEKYFIIRSELLKYLTQDEIKKLPAIPYVTRPQDYAPVQLTEKIDLNDLLDFVEPITSDHPLPMEELPIHSNGGQSFGFILYRSQIGLGRRLWIQGKIVDRAVVLLNGVHLHTIEGATENVHIDLANAFASGKIHDLYTLDILVENTGRINYADYNKNVINEQRKGILGSVALDENVLTSWKIYPLEFKKPFINAAITSNAKKPAVTHSNSPHLLYGSFKISGERRDTYVNMRGFTKGVVFLNGFNLGRYWNIGPQFALYAPAPLLRENNQLVVFEIHGSTTNTLQLNKSPDFQV